MKIKQLIIICMFVCNHIYSQDIVHQLKFFYENADMNCYIGKIQKNIIDEHNLFCQWDSLYNVPSPNINLHDEQIVPMLTIQFVNTENYCYDDNIYNYLSIDSVRVFTIACVDKKMKVFAFANFFDGLHALFDLREYPFNSKKEKKLKQVIKNINKQHPELILYCSALSGFHDDNGFMYIKNNEIFVYRVIENDVFELNEYVKKFFSLERIRNLNYQFIPMIYQNGGPNESRRTGNDPENEKMLCPVLNLP